MRNTHTHTHACVLCTYLPRALGAVHTRCGAAEKPSGHVNICLCTRHSTIGCRPRKRTTFDMHARFARTPARTHVRKATVFCLWSQARLGSALTDLTTKLCAVRVRLCKCCPEITGIISYSPVLAVTTRTAATAAAAADSQAGPINIISSLCRAAQRASHAAAYSPECEATCNREHGPQRRRHEIYGAANICMHTQVSAHTHTHTHRVCIGLGRLTGIQTDMRLN